MKKLLAIIVLLIFASCKEQMVIERQSRAEHRQAVINDKLVDQLGELEMKLSQYNYKLLHGVVKSEQTLRSRSELEAQVSADRNALLLSIIKNQKYLLSEVERLGKLHEQDTVITPPEEAKAFPTAYGAGAYVTGGRGYLNYFVTSLANSGAGTFRQALTDIKSNGGGNVIFNVSGTIVLTSTLDIRDLENFTIFGQSAPVGGIAVVCSGDNVRFDMIGASNFIIRYFKYRPNYSEYPTTEKDAGYFYNCSNYIIDHCSFSWGTDENADSGAGSNYTWQRNLFAESNKTGMIMGAEPDRSENFSFLENVFYNCSHRFPNWQSDGRVDIINNVIWNYRGGLHIPQGGFQVNHINNYYQYFRNNPTTSSDKWINWYPFNVAEGGLSEFPSIYSSGNYVSDVLTDANADNWKLWRFRFDPTGSPYQGAGTNGQLTTDFKVSEPFGQLGKPIDIATARDAFNDLPNDVGANKYMDDEGRPVFGLDGPDTVYISNLKAKNLVPWEQTNVLNTSHRSSFISSISTTPINTRSTNFDTDNDGMADAWEIRTFGNLSQAANADADGDGYTNLDKYLNQ